MQGSAGAGKKTYVEDVFSTYLYKGNGSSLTITNGIDLAGEGGLVWLKSRGTAENNNLWDTVRGVENNITSNTTTQQGSIAGVTAFNSDGFTLGSEFQNNQNNIDNSSWTFRKTPGFFDIVSYAGTGSAHNIAHNLGSVPGCIIIKNLASGYNWKVYHNKLDLTNPGNYSLNLDQDIGRASSSATWNNTAPTSTHFTVGTNTDVNGSGSNYIAYLFAGANTTRWSRMISPASGTFDFPATRAFDGLLQSNPNRLRTSGNQILVTMTISPAITVQAGQSVVIYGEDAAIGNPYGYSGTATVTIDGTTYTSSTGDTHTFSHSGQLTQITYQGNSPGGRTYLEGIRVNGDLLTDGSFFVNGNPNYTAGEESKFGEDGDQSIVKCGEYVGNGSGTGPIVNLGWEPQWLMFKCDSNNENWRIYDSMRGWITGSPGDGPDMTLLPNTTNAEITNQNFASITPTGFKVVSSDASINGNGDRIVYIAIRRPDGYVGKPAAAGTDVFAMDAGNNSQTIPAFDSGWPVDFATSKYLVGADNWITGSRLTGKEYLRLNQNNGQTQWSGMVWDSNVGWNQTRDTDYQSWMWKRGQSFDVVTYTGNEAPSQIPHSLGRPPEMIWTKVRSASVDWTCWHKGLNGGTNAQNYWIKLNNVATAEISDATVFGTLPTSSVFYLGSGYEANYASEPLIAMLFASVDGISKCGYYDGSASEQTITTGFQPRFVIIKSNSNASEPWVVLDTLRGWGAGNDKWLKLNEDVTSVTNNNCGAPISTGFTVTNDGGWNYQGRKYIYYAHA